MESTLSVHHKKTYRQLFAHPMPQNLQWIDVRHMLEAIPGMTVEEDDKGNIKLNRHSQALSLHRPRGKDFDDKEELKKVRHFLDHSAKSEQPPAAAGTHLLVVIDHREAKIYSAELQGAVPERITPYDPFGFGRALHYKQDDSNGQRKPELKSFYEAVAKTLKGAKQILLFGSGTGAASAMEQLVLDLKKNHHELADRIVGTVAVDDHHLTDNQLLAKARELFAVTT